MSHATEYFHIIIETNEKQKDKYFITHIQRDVTDAEEIKNRIVKPFLEKKDFQFIGYFLQPQNVRRIQIRSTIKDSNELSAYENDNLPAGIFAYISPDGVISSEKHSKDVTSIFFDEVRNSVLALPEIKNEGKKLDKTKVFIVHGRDEQLKTEIARYIERLNLEAIILHEQANQGKTIIEKIETYSDVGFAVVLYTACDEGKLIGSEADSRFRARQNVVFEHGYLIAKLSRSKVAAIVKGDIEIPNDISGVVYIDYQEEWKFKLAKELRTAGYIIDMNKVI